MLDLGLIYVHYMTGLGLLLTFWELLLSSSLGILDPFIGVPRLQEIAEELLNTCIVQPCLQFAGSKMLSEFRPSKGKPCGGWASNLAFLLSLERNSRCNRKGNTCQCQLQHFKAKGRQGKVGGSTGESIASVC